jgi:predicted metalloprotease
VRFPRRRSGSDIEDRRGSGGSLGGGGLPIPIPAGAGGGGIGLIILIALIFFLGRGCVGGDGGLGIDPIDQFPQGPAPGTGATPDPDAKLVDFVGAVTGDAQDFWATQFSASNRQYERAKLVLFTNATRTACGTGSSQTGPFYCPLDRNVYIDLSFFRALESRFGAPGDFAQAYVIAHELGHHVQNLLGINQQVREQQQQNPDRQNDLSIRLELQADCLAGVWGHSTYERGILESGDLEEGLRAAAAVGDDRLGASPENWTHGSAAQRQQWFQKGFDSGDADTCDTFAGDI